MKHVKKIALFAAFVMVFSLIAGYLPTAKASSEYEVNEMEGKVTFQYWDEAQKDAMTETIAEFNKRYPNIEIEPTIIPSSQYFTGLQTALLADNAPDVFWLNNYISLFVAAGVLVDFTDRVAADQVDMTVFPEELKNVFTIEEKLYGIPKDMDTIALVYNKDLFGDTPLPTSDWTWDDLLSTAKAVTTDNVFGVVANINSDQEGFGNFVRQAGGFIPSDGKTGPISTPEQIEALGFIRKLMHEDKVAPAPADLNEMPALDTFLNGMAAMYITGSWNMSKIYEVFGDKVGVVELAGGKEKASQLNGLCYSMAKTAEDNAAAWEFVKFMATDTAQAIQAKAVIPAHQGVAAAWSDQFENIDTKAFIDTAAYAKIQMPMSNTKAFNMYTEAVKTINIGTSADIKDTLDAAQANMEAELN